MHEPRMTLLRNSALSILAFCFLTFNVAQAQTWKTYSYPDDAFSASFPAEPTAGKKEFQTAAGTCQLHSHAVNTGSATFYIGVCDYGSGVKSADSLELLQDNKNKVISSYKLQFVREKKITLGVYPGFEIEGESESTSFHDYIRIYMVGATIYQTVVVTPQGKPSDDTLRFLDSFQLIARVGS